MFPSVSPERKARAYRVKTPAVQQILIFIIFPSSKTADLLISVLLSVAICHDVYKSELILNGKISSSILDDRTRNSHSHALARNLGNIRLFPFISLLSHALRSLLSLNAITLLYQQFSLAAKPYPAHCYSFLLSSLNEAVEKL